jgi:hypothetical protein
MVKGRELTHSPVGTPLVPEYPWIVRWWYPLAVSATMADEEPDGSPPETADDISDLHRVVGSSEALPAAALTRVWCGRPKGKKGRRKEMKSKGEGTEEAILTKIILF